MAETEHLPQLRDRAIIGVMAWTFARVSAVVGLDVGDYFRGGTQMEDSPTGEGGTGGYARYVAICPPDWDHGVTMEEAPGAPLPEYDRPLRRNEHGVLRPAPPDSEQ